MTGRGQQAQQRHVAAVTVSHDADPIWVDPVKRPQELDAAYLISHFDGAEPAVDGRLENGCPIARAAVVELEHTIAVLRQHLHGDWLPLVAHALYARAAVDVHNHRRAFGGSMLRAGLGQPVVQDLAVLCLQRAQSWATMSAQKGSVRAALRDRLIGNGAPRRIPIGGIEQPQRPRHVQR